MSKQNPQMMDDEIAQQMITQTKNHEPVMLITQTLTLTQLQSQNLPQDKTYLLKLNI